MADHTPERDQSTFGELEEWLAETADKTSSDRALRLDQLAALLVGSAAHKGNAAFDDLFDATHQRAKRRLTAFTLLRLLCANDDVFEDQALRVRTFALTDDVLPDVYKLIGLTPGSQGYEKRRELSSYIKDSSEAFADAVRAPTTLAELAQYRARAMRGIRSGRLRPFIDTFLDGKVHSSFDAFTASVDRYLDSPPTGLRMSYAAVEAAFDDVVDACKGNRSQYSSILAEACSATMALVEAEYRASPANQPARLTLMPSEKKHPLTQAGSFDVLVSVENRGPGVATDLRLDVTAGAPLTVPSGELYVGTMIPGRVTVSVPVEVVPTDSDGDHSECVLIAKVIWTNSDGSIDQYEHIFELESQRSDIDWDRVTASAVYSLEAVETDRELVGRSELLGTLHTMAEASAAGNAYVYGQRRVGKTSIVKTLRTRIVGNPHDHEHIVVYLEAGDYITPDAASTIDALGELLCEDIIDAHSDFAGLSVPRFESALSPISRFFRSALKISPDARFTIILDEFDVLPPELFRRSELGDAFFQTLRSLASKPQIGVLLVGAENLPEIIAVHDDMVNKFKPVRVDYFDRSTDWPDFVNLVRKPVESWLEISDDGVVSLYEQAAGNPFFTNLICRELAQIQQRRHDSHATGNEVDTAVEHAVRLAAGNSFSHFWRDGILATGEEAEAVSLQRRKVLLAIADCLRSSVPASEDAIALSARRFGLSADAVAHHLGDFCQRQVLELQADVYHCRVPLFERWLKERGVDEIIATNSDLEELQALALSEDAAAYVTPVELVGLVERWGSFKGQVVTTDHVRAWLEQFGRPTNQRLMYQLLAAVDFYDGTKIRELLREGHRSVLRNFHSGSSDDIYGAGRYRRSDIIVSSLDGIGKSGPHYARLYADENAVYVRNVVSSENLSAALEENQEAKAVVFVDDFIGTGSSAAANVSRVLESVPADMRPNVDWYLVVLCGFDHGVDVVTTAAERIGVPLEVVVCRPLTDDDRSFEGTRAFPNPEDRRAARALAYEHGAKLMKRDPLGHGGSEALVVFDSSIPNNSLPILWQQSGDWSPLFRRL